MGADTPAPARPGPGRFLFDPAAGGTSNRLWPRWLFLRSLGFVYFSVFYSLAFQIHGLIGPSGILPAGGYLAELAKQPLALRLLVAPTLLWLSSGDAALTALVAVGFVGSAALFLNLWPRAAIAVCTVAFLSFIGAAQDFAAYQSDGMLLEASFAGFFFAPRGLRPGLGAGQPPSRASLFLLQWLWFRIYFESGVAKLASGEPAWRNLTAMDEYYQNGPLPTWLGYYAQQALPHAVHAFTAGFTLVAELLLVLLAALPRPLRLACFALVTPFQLGIILTANYAFLNYLVLFLGLLLLDDELLGRLLWRRPPSAAPPPAPRWRMAVAGALMTWQLYSTLAVFFAAGPPLLLAPALPLAQLRFANRYGLFAVMTPARYEIEFQGTCDGRTWTAYPFRYKPQDPMKAPGIFAPYQPRFDWNLWFASLEPPGSSLLVLSTQARLVQGSPAVLSLFAGDPFGGVPPVQVRAVLWRYGFTDLETHRRTGAWWRREELGLYSPPFPPGAP